MSREWKTPMLEGPVSEAEKAKARVRDLEDEKRRLLSNGGELIPISDKVLEQLSDDWYGPVECKVEDGELIFRKAWK